MPKEVWLVRHGEAGGAVTESGPDGAPDPCNPPLTRLGEQQAREVAGALASFAPDLVLTSPFMRAVQTAWPHIETSGRKAVIDFRLGESFGFDEFSTFAGLNVDEYRARFADAFENLDLIGQRESYPRYPETPEQVDGRAGDLWAEFLRRSEPRIVFVAHGASLGALARAVTGEHRLVIGHANAAISCFRNEDGHWRVLEMGGTRHLSVVRGPLAF